MPLTSNGKVDRKALPSVTGEDVIKKEYVAPRNAAEKKMLEIWKEVLGIEKVGITDNFFELGGHSLVVVQLINQTQKQLNQTISFKEFFSNPTIAFLSDKLKENNYIAIPKAQEATSYPLTASQNRLWIVSQLEGGSLAYNMPAAVQLTGDIDIAKFEASFIRLIDRHEILRTSFKTDLEGEVRQFIIPIEGVSFRMTQKSFSKQKNQDQLVSNYLEEINKEVFDLKQGPLVRTSLIELKKNNFIFFLSMHHIIGDGWSMELLISEVVRIYNSLLEGKEADLPELNIQYKDYAVWINESLQQEKHQKAEDFWMEQFSGDLPVLNLPSFKTRPSIKTYNGASFTHEFPKTFLDKLKGFSEKYQSTLFMTLMTGVKVLLHKYSGQDDIILGTPIAGREHSDLENQIGLYLNTLAIRTQFKENATFLDLLKQEKTTLLGAYAHQAYPFDELVGKLNLKRDMSRSALFDVLVTLQSQGQVRGIRIEESLSGLQVDQYNFTDNTSQFDIIFNFLEQEGLGLSIQYNTDIYNIELIERMFIHFENLLDQSLGHPETLIQEIDYLTQEEKQHLLVDFNDTRVAYPGDKTIIDLFEEQ
ncbi:condensation domain-containing protein, partial [Flavobacterium sp. ZB4P13]|uniref:condensation domain-containing protein n=1 Tax=Flavobacterium sp. ZB4P13 TaxID=3401728 RepID=UPI003AABDBDF